MSKKNLSIAVSCLSWAGLAVSQVVFAMPATAQSSAAFQASNKLQLREFHLRPRLNLWGFTGDRTLAEGQLLAPLYGNQARVLYFIAEGNYEKHDDGWLAGAGLGYRQVIDDRIWGGYVLADNASLPDNNFVIINPGLEMLGNVWDVRVNGYWPLHGDRQFGKAGWAGDDFGDYRFTRPTGHEYYDHFMQQYAELGRGCDFEVARVVPHFEDAKLHVGAYHFNTSDLGSTSGAEAKLTYDLNKYSRIEVADNYDNTHHNQFLVGLRFTFGGYSKEEKREYGIATRLLDPIENGALIKTSGLLPLKKGYVDEGEKKEHDNVWYFKAAAQDVKNAGVQGGSGTAEDPFIGFTPDNYGAINPNIGSIDRYPLMYFAPGEYSFNGFSVTRNGLTMDGRFDLPDDFGMYGKTDGYKMPAFSEQRARFHGGLDIVSAGEVASESSVQSTVLDSVQIVNNQSGLDNAALFVRNESDVILRNANIENKFTITTETSNNEVYGIYMNNSTLNFLSLNDFAGGGNTVSAIGVGAKSFSCDGYGVLAENHSVINFSGGWNAIRGEGTGFNTFGYGISAKSSSINFNAGTNDIFGFGMWTGAPSFYFNKGYGIEMYDGSAINFFGGVNKITGKGAGAAAASGEGVGIGVFADSSVINFVGGVNTIEGKGFGTDSSGDYSRAYGFGYSIYANNSSLNFIGGSNKVVAYGIGTSPAYGESNAYGIYAYNNSAINFVGGVNTISATGAAYGLSEGSGHGESFGISADNSTLNFLGGVNTIMGTSTGTVYGSGTGDGFGYGLSIDGSVVNFIGGANYIFGAGYGNAAASGSSDGVGYGISATNSIINFANSCLNKVTIGASGSTGKQGISADDLSDVQRYGISLPHDTDINVVQEFITFDSSGHGGGKAVVGGINDLDIDWPEG